MSHKVDLGLAIALLGLAAVLYAEALRAPASWFPGDVGVAAMPIAITLVLIGLSGLLLLQALTCLFHKAGTSGHESHTTNAKAWKLGKLFGCIGTLTLYILMLDGGWLPYWLPSIVFVFAFAFILSQWTLANVLRCAALAIGSVLVIVLVFNHLFKVVMP